MTAKLTMIYGNPVDEDEFERRYTAHQEIVKQVPDILRAEYGKVFPKEDGTPRPRWRTADLYFADYDTAVAAFEHENGAAVARDAVDLATGGVEFLLSEVGD
ncbi:EthD family reductase [Cellulomonas fengjieae]|uniref:EthD family reductase n=1 Tax=Cellulomonas fengjieae TaxID=2819978 RepID=A0ABS3SFX4_9CELL|nr:EthD family reductase [Cellulomonas fengjieae]MBO3084661.1 EthD family reductase [Cellulomonas fengjieae]MBO3103433.1 EthD family reductase [Cellulomonas fengjieae]QVI67015.1 EthD family reductase [Cellulomonas fengjieae]